MIQRSGTLTLSRRWRKPAAVHSARFLAERLLCFFLPLASFLFLASGPHEAYASLLWTAPVWICILADIFSPSACDLELGSGTSCHFDLTLYVLFSLQLLNIYLMLQLSAGLNWGEPSELANSVAAIIAMRVLTGTASCCSGISVAHELIHRNRRHQRWMGRILLWTVLYDHFAVEHILGHHRFASTPGDCATARFGEAFKTFCRRTMREQLQSAWNLESRRIAHLPKWLRMLRHRVLGGLVIQFCLLSLIGTVFGPVALLMFIYQAFSAVRLLEAVNYIQHWGLARGEGRFGATDAWATDSWFTLHSFVGLAFHAHHHEFAGTPYYLLRQIQESPRMPCGYFGMAILVRWFDDRYREFASEELRTRKLGPYRPTPLPRASMALAERS